MEKNILARITVDPEIMVDKPIIKGTRLKVHFILNLLAQGMTTDDILEEYGTLTKEDILACILFFQDV